MSDATTDFFESLADRRHEPLLGRTTGSIRVDLADGGRDESWLVTIAHGDITVAHSGGEADASVRASRELFDGFARGEVNVMAALLRGAIAIDGDLELIALFQRLFPGPQESAAERATAARASNE